MISTTIEQPRRIARVFEWVFKIKRKEGVIMTTRYFDDLTPTELLEIDGGDPLTVAVVVLCSAYMGIWVPAMKNALKPPTL